MPALSYLQRRSQIEHYFDRTAAEAWKRLTSDAPVGRIRATVRAGRERMRSLLLGWLPEDLGGRRLLDAGCGTGMLAIEAARRGAEVVAVDISPTLVEQGRTRLESGAAPGSVEFVVGDMLDARLGAFDHVIAMDSLIHYRLDDCVEMAAQLAARARESVLFTFAPRTPALTLMHAVGRLVPQREHRAPAIEPAAPAALRRRIAAHCALSGWRAGRTERVASGFYTSQALELIHSSRPSGMDGSH